MSFLPYINYYILGVLLLIVGLLSLMYLFNYQLPAIALQLKTKKINRQLRELSLLPEGSVAPDDLEDIFKEKPFNYLWREYRGSLHQMENEGGKSSSVRSTLTSDFYFSKDSVVDAYISAEFFKHLPGILTGVGIIGTFSGLIWGLHQFNSGNAIETLNLLLGEVSSAFLGSGIAIFVAIIITFFEKQAINTCYQLIEETTKLLDSLYKAGVGEDYLARLVRANELSAENSKNLKDILVDNLEILINKQSIVIGQSIAAALDAPISKLMITVDKTSGDQSAVIRNLVDSLMSTFIKKIDEAFGTQIDAVNQAIYRSTATIESVEGSMRRLLEDIGTASQEAVKSMSEQMLATIIQANVNQEDKNQLLRNVMEELQEKNTTYQSVYLQTLETSMAKILGNYNASMTEFANAKQAQIEIENERSALMISSTKELHGGVENILSHAMSEQNTLNSQLKQYVDDINALSQQHQLESKEVTEQLIQKVLDSVDQSIVKVAESRADLTQQDLIRNTEIITSAKVFQEGIQSILQQSMNDQYGLNLKLKDLVVELNQTNFEQQTQYKEVFEQTVQTTLSSVAGHVDAMTQAQNVQNEQAELRNQALLGSTKDLHEGIAGILGQSMQDQHSLNLQLKVFVEDLNQTNIDQQLKYKDVFEKTVQSALSSVADQVEVIAQSQNLQNEQSALRNQELLGSTKNLHQGIAEILNQSMQDQHGLNLQLKDFVSELNQMSHEHLLSAKDLMLQSTVDVTTQLQKSLALITSERSEQMLADQGRANLVIQSTQRLHDGVDAQVTALIASVSRSIEQSNQHIQAIGNVSTDAILQMNTGAQQMDQAAQQFRSAGDTVIAAFLQNQTITEQMADISSNLKSMLGEIMSLFKQFEKSSNTHQDYVQELTQLIVKAKAESGISTQIVSDLEQSLAHIRSLEGSSKDYLDRVSEVLEEAFKQFNIQMMAQVTGINQENDRLLGSAIGALTGAVEQIVVSTTKLRNQ